ncbi:hypothetical protein SAMN04488103_102331 [Gemmobacter aquatilis]|uniref:Uncharacterized protein n=1 Tax=Gemmobacter aquatilis TaxID=933059 RepID=A0A1H8BZE0_9RHOB|nr:hypothetical protein SAMN04488103_102331 [Gemmobacter aquatilis]
MPFPTLTPQAELDAVTPPPSLPWGALAMICLFGLLLLWA